MSSQPTRIAEVWTPDGSVNLRVVGDWPEAIAHGRWIVSPELDQQSRPLVHRGRHSGAEFVRYKVARRVTCADIPAVIEAFALWEELHGDDGKQSDADRSDRQGEREHVGQAPRRRRGRVFGGHRDGAEV